MASYRAANDKINMDSLVCTLTPEILNRKKFRTLYTRQAGFFFAGCLFQHVRPGSIFRERFEGENIKKMICTNHVR